MIRTHLHHLLEAAASEWPESPALTYKDDTVSYAELWGRVVKVATGLETLGLTRDERVAVYLDKRIETVAAIFGTSAAGGVFVPVNHILKPPQVAYILEDCDVRVLITTQQRLALLGEELKTCRALQHVILVDEQHKAEWELAGDYDVHSWATVCTGQPAEGIVPTPGVDFDMAAILYTSGSTGKPKGVVLSHRNLLVGAESVSAYLENTSDDVILSALPLSFDAGFSQLTTAFFVGAHVILMNYLVPRDVLRLCARHGVTGLTCVPPLWIQIVDLTWSPEAAATMRYIANTGGRMPKATLDRIRETFPIAKPFLMYGLTEAFRSTYLDPNEVDRRPDSIGKAIPNAEILVVRPDGSSCSPGEEGELIHRGPLVAMGYWNNPEQTAQRFRPTPGPTSNWRAPEIAVWSGDAAVMDEDGYLYFVGRKDDMIKTSGYRVSPTEVEEAAYDTGLVRDVVALGVDDDRLGHRIVLVVTAPVGRGLDADTLLTDLRRSLPLFMVPSTIVTREQLPKSPNGKFDRTLIRQELA